MLFADIASAKDVMSSVVSPLVLTLSAIAGLVFILILIYSGFQYITSSGNPEKLQASKKIMKDCLIGIVLIIGAATITAILNHAYGSQPTGTASNLPNLAAIKPQSTSPGLVGVLIDAITGMLQDLIQSIARPIISALDYFTSGTPLVADNPSVFSLWLITAAVADSLFVLIVGLLGFHVMSASTLGLDELDIKHIFPQILVTFLCLNSSIFLIDIIITLSNGMINAVKAGFDYSNVWTVLEKVTDSSGSTGLAGLLIMIIFLVLAFILLVYYVGRLVTLYLGAVLAPILILLWLLPSFKDFASNAAKTYLSTVFVLFIHVIILLLASSIFAGLVSGSASTPDTIMSLIVGMSTLLALIKTQGVLAQLNYASIGPKAIRRLSSQFVRGLSGTSYSYSES
ncbi:MAG TPA: type IV secretion system protein [Candidatus Sulfotelmatobacter sp.]|nr:type IV secretion system protein [Candidatus Sulfotelmatobacter sp.]